MKKTIHFLLISILFLAGCSDKTEFTLKGQINGLASDTLLAYFQLPEYKIDTIFCKKGVFEYTFTPDTTTVFSLIFNEEESLPIFAEKGQTVEVKGSTANPVIKGKGDNKLMNEILTLLKEIPNEEKINIIDSLIKTNNSSFTNLYLIDKYYLRSEEIDYNHIKELIESQNGIIKDTPFLMELQTNANDFTYKSRNRTIHTIAGQERTGKPCNWTNQYGHYTLIDFWASWHPESVNEQDSLVNVLKALKKEKFQIYSLSLDMDREAWLKASDRDTTQWHQICDFKGWNNNILKSQNIRKLPANILLDRNKRIIARDIRGKELIDKVKELIQKDKEREKEKANRKRKK